MARKFGKHGRRKKQVPNLSGLTRSQAQTELTARGFSYSESSSNTATSGDDTMIASQSIAADTTLLYGESVPFVYYTYVAPYYNPYSNPPPYYNPYSNPPPYDNPYYNPYSNPPPYDNTYYNPYSNPPPYDNTYYNPYSNPPPYYNPYSNPPSGGGGCHVFGTQILMADGTYKNMEDLQIGDAICGASIPTLPDEEYPNYVDFWNISETSGIEKISSVVTAKIYDAFDSYYRFNNLINITKEHLIFAKISGESVWKFVAAEYLNVGDSIFDENLQEVIISSKELISEQVQTITIDTEPKDVYFTKGMLAHNIICADCGAKQ